MSKLKQQLKRDEGVIPHAYKDSEGHLTIGVGFLIDKEKGGFVPDFIIDLWLDYLIEQTRRELSNAFSWFRNLDKVRQDAITNMVYQLGLPNFRGFKKTIALLKAGAYSAAADEMLDSRWAKQTPERAKRVSEQIRTGKYV